jgi:hypothetical protein
MLSNTSMILQNAQYIVVFGGSHVDGTEGFAASSVRLMAGNWMMSSLPGVLLYSIPQQVSI